MLKVRREGKDQKKNFSLKQQAPFAKPLPSLVKPAMEAGQDNPEWLISEDWALLQVLALLTPSLETNIVDFEFYVTLSYVMYTQDPNIIAIFLTGCKAAAGAASEPDNRVSCPHS